MKVDDLHQNIIDNSPDFVFESRLDNFQFTKVNKRACDFYGYTTSEFLNMKIFDIEVSPPVKDEVRRLYDNTLVGEVLEVLGINKKKDGSEFPVHVRFSKISEELAIAHVQDITRQKEQELLSKKHQFIFEKTSQISRIGTWEVDLITGSVKWSDVVKEIHEVDMAYVPILEAGINFYTEGWSRTKLTEVVNEAIEHGTPFDEKLTILSDKNNIRWVRAIGMAEMKNNKAIRLFGIFQDYTEQKMVEKALKESEEKYRTLFEMSYAAIMTLNKVGFIECNQATLDLFGCKDRGEFLGKHPGDISPLYQEDGKESHIAADEKIATAYETGENFFEWTHCRIDGTNFPAEVLLTPMKIEGEEVLQAVVRDISVRKKNEKEILFKNALFASQSETSSEGILVISDDNEIESISQSIKEMWSIPEKIWLRGDHDEMLQYILTQLKNPNEFLKKMEYLNNHKKEHSKEEIELKNRKILDRFIAPLYDSEKKYHGRVLYFHDITDLKNSDKENRALKENYKDLYDNAPIMYMSIDTKGEILGCNNKVHEVLGYNQKELVGMPMRKFLTQESIASFKKEFPILIDKGFLIERERQLVTKTGEIIDTLLSVSMEYDANGKPLNTRATFVDISERKKVSIELQKAKDKEEENKNYLNTIINNIGDPVFVKDEQSKLLLVNGAFCNLFKMAESEIIGKTLAENVSPEERDSFLSIDKQVLKDGKENINEENITISGGESLTIVTRKTRFIDAKGKKHLVGVIRDISERKIAEEKIVRSEELYRDLYESIPMGYFVADDEGRIITCNQQAIDMLGYSPEEIRGASVIDLYANTPYGKEKAKKINKKVKNGETIIGEEMQMSNSKGIPIWVSLNIQPAKGLHQRRGLVENITARKEIEESLRLSNERWKLAIEGAKDGIWDWNILTGEVYYSPQWEKMFGFEVGEAEQTLETMSKVVHPEDVDDMYTEVNRYFSKETQTYSYDFRMYHKDGSIIWTRHKASAFFDESGTPLRMIGTTSDITEEHKHREIIIQTLDQAVDGVVTIGTDKKIIYFNKAAEKLWGYSQEEVIGTNINMLVPDENKAAHNGYIEANIKTGINKIVGKSRDVQVQRKDGSRFWANLAIAKINVEGVIQYTAFIKDISDRKIIEAQIGKALKEKDVLLKEIHHRVKNNLQIIWGLLDIQEKRTGSNKIKSALLDSKGRINTMAFIHENLYRGEDFSNIDLGIYIGKLVRNIQSINLLPGLNIKVHNDIKNIKLGLDIITPLALIMNELVSNVFKHAFVGLKKGTVNIDLQHHNMKYVLTVVDNGIGLPNDFEINKTKSMGITLVQRLSKQMEASFDITSNNGIGTVAKIIFHE